MGSRGPLPRSGRAVQLHAEAQRRLGDPGHRIAASSARAPLVVSSPARAVPAAPRALGPAGRAQWRAAWRAAWLDRSTDVPAVVELARLADEVAVYRKALEDRGSLLEEPIVSPRGDVVGHRLVANPAEAMARRAGRMLVELSKELGLSPASRARLGLVVVEVETKRSRLDELIDRRRT